MNETGKCLKCGNENEYSKVICDFCSARLPWASVVQSTSTNKTAPVTTPKAAAPLSQAMPKKQSQVIVGCLGLFFGVLALLWLIGTITPKTFSESLAYSYAKAEIRNKLKAPSTAQFPYSTDRGVFITKKDGHFYVLSYVEAKNLFGVPLRKRWSATVTPSANNESGAVSDAVIYD
jgi:hypothetical protein